MEIIVEQLTRGHKLISRDKFSNGEVNIGRAYSNDIIVSDPHVCPVHLQISFDGNAWIAQDKASINGSVIEQSNQPVHNHVIESGDIICFGKTMIRLIFPNHAIAKTIPFSPFEDLVDFARQPLIMACNILVFLAIAAWISYINKPIEVTWQHVAAPAIGMTLGFLSWPIVVSLVSHFTKNDARVMYQIGICFIFFNLFVLSSVLESIVYFNTSAHWSIAHLVVVLPISLAFGLFWLNCYIGFHMTAVRRFVTAGVLTTLLFGGSALVQLSKQPEFSPLPSYDATIMVPTLQFSSSSSVDDFVEQSQALFEQTRKQSEQEKE